MSLGFTGTREGMAIDQHAAFEQIVSHLMVDRKVDWHDGDCIGADDQAHKSVATLSHVAQTLHRVGHPCNLPKWRAWGSFDETREILAPLVRNRVIVRESDIMFAAPKEYQEEFRGSGTWATIRHANRLKKPLFLIWPDGSVEVSNIDDGLAAGLNPSD